MQEKLTTNSAKETQKLGENFAKNILNLPSKNSATVLCLNGNLGGGKTTFLQGFAKGLGIKERILSPTFVILKNFKIKNIATPKNKYFSSFYHIDCYRLNKPTEILELDFKNIIKNPKNIVAIEWPEKIKKVLPKNIIKIDFKFIDENKREINFKNVI